jgi:hypothetical protein
VPKLQGHQQGFIRQKDEKTINIRGMLVLPDKVPLDKDENNGNNTRHPKTIHNQHKGITNHAIPKGKRKES